VVRPENARPFHLVANARVLVPDWRPTAMQFDVVVHATPDSWLCVEGTE
jgi:hypothetical protein